MVRQLHRMPPACLQVDAMNVESLGQNYDPALLERMFENRKLDLNSRAVEVAGKLGLFISSLAGDFVLGAQTVERNQPKRAKELTRILSDLGPSFVKLGQALSLRPDLLPKVTMFPFPSVSSTKSRITGTVSAKLALDGGFLRLMHS